MEILNDSTHKLVSFINIIRCGNQELDQSLEVRDGQYVCDSKRKWRGSGDQPLTTDESLLDH